MYVSHFKVSSNVNCFLYQVGFPISKLLEVGNYTAYYTTLKQKEQFIRNYLKWMRMSRYGFHTEYSVFEIWTSVLSSQFLQWFLQFVSHPSFHLSQLQPESVNQWYQREWRKQSSLCHIAWRYQKNTWPYTRA